MTPETTEKSRNTELFKIVEQHAFDSVTSTANFVSLYDSLIAWNEAEKQKAVAEFAQRLWMKVYEDEDDLARLAISEEDARNYRKLANALVERIKLSFTSYQFESTN